MTNEDRETKLVVEEITHKMLKYGLLIIAFFAGAVFIITKIYAFCVIMIPIVILALWYESKSYKKMISKILEEEDC